MPARTLFHGKVETYQGIRLEGKILVYRFNQREKVVARGKVRIGRGGEFTIAVNKTWDAPYAIYVLGFDGKPESVLYGGSRGFENDQEKFHELGTLYSYADLTIVGIPKEPILLRDLSLEVRTNVPNIEYYEGRLYSSRNAKLIAFSFKGSHLSFKAAGDALETPGSHELGELKVVIGNEKVVGRCEFFIDAMRIVDGEPNIITSSGWLSITIVDAKLAENFSRK